MMSRRVFSFLFFFLFSQILSFAFNPLQSNNPQLLQDVIEKIALKQKWEPEGLNFSKLELSKVRFGTGKRYEFRIRFGKTHMLFKFPDEVSSLKKFTRRNSDDFLDFVNEINSSAVLEPFTMEGPFELRLSPGHQASLLLPLNTSHTDLKRVLVGHGITLQDTIELLPEKCYGSDGYTKQPCPIDSISLRIARLQKILRTFIGDRNNEKQFLGSLNVKIKASPIVHFQLELEKEIGNNESVRSMLAEWRTKPTVERLWFDVMTRVEGDKLNPLTLKKVRPFVSVDTVSWSNLLSNISFTKFPSILVPPEALTLGVKW
ncbi:hypothetical protein GOBAR_AA32683 [Gossypium barbadense]|uniref:Uncharacterized protein n=1 Tax=Gossypium barbadense TaxID=3634 RepID=A0A2P5WAD7_GOSBA|nr:hypothetical protein GOBAR_AA32683 [Gossypium barbadense]